MRALVASVLPWVRRRPWLEPTFRIVRSASVSSTFWFHPCSCVVFSSFVTRGSEAETQRVALAAFERQYEDDFSWEALEVDSRGRLKASRSGAAARLYAARVARRRAQRRDQGLEEEDVEEDGLGSRDAARMEVTEPFRDASGEASGASGVAGVPEVGAAGPGRGGPGAVGAAVPLVGGAPRGAPSSSAIRRGLVRHVCVVLDCSSSAGLSDLRPTRGHALTGAAATFLRRFFEDNPLGSACVVSVRDGLASRLSNLSDGPLAQRRALRAARAAGWSGAFSLQNALQAASEALRRAPAAGTREAVVLVASIASADAGDVRATAAQLRRAGVRVGVVGLGAEVFVFGDVCHRTRGTYDVAGDADDLDAALAARAKPPVARKQHTNQGNATHTDANPNDQTATPADVAPSFASGLVALGFPARARESVGAASFVGEAATLRPGGHVCPACLARVADVPSACHVCGLSLAAAARLARAYRHIFPLPEQVRERTRNDGAGKGKQGRHKNARDGAGKTPCPAHADQAPQAPRDTPNSTHHVAEQWRTERGGGARSDSLWIESERLLATTQHAHDTSDAETLPRTLCLACSEAIPRGRPRDRCAACGARFHPACGATIREIVGNCPGCERKRADATHS